MSSHHSRPSNLPQLLSWPALLTRDALRAWDALLTSGAFLSLGALLGPPVPSLASALSVHHFSTWISFLWIVKKGVPNNGKRQWSLSEEKKRKPTPILYWSYVSRCSDDMTWIFSWVGVLEQLRGAATRTSLMNLRCFELHRYHHLGQFRELWHLFLFVLSFVLFICCAVVVRNHLK